MFLIFFVWLLFYIYWQGNDFIYIFGHLPFCLSELLAILSAAASQPKNSIPLTIFVANKKNYWYCLYCGFMSMAFLILGHLNTIVSALNFWHVACWPVLNPIIETLIFCLGRTIIPAYVGPIYLSIREPERTCCWPTAAASTSLACI